LEVKEIYKALGYSIVAYTDHDILISHDDLCDEEFLALHGFEMEINQYSDSFPKNSKTCHICFIGIDPENMTQPLWHRSKYLFANAPKMRSEVKFDNTLPDYERVYSSEGITEIMNKGREAGFFITYNHPAWSQESYPEYMGYSGMCALEILNGSCNVFGYDDCNQKVYDDILKSGKRIFCVGGDDNHNVNPLDSRKSDSGKAYTVIMSPTLEYKDVTAALVNGDCYASEGPEIKELWYEDGKVHIKTSAADAIYLNTGVRFAQSKFSENDVPLTEASFTVIDESVYFRLTVVDKFGRRAFTNAYFLDEL